MKRLPPSYCEADGLFAAVIGITFIVVNGYFILTKCFSLKLWD